MHHHQHGPHHGHEHHHHAIKNITVAFIVNSVLALIEIAGGIYFNSMAVLSNGLHDVGDSLSLGTAWYFQKKSAKRRDAVYTYGYRRFALLGAFINSIVLVVGSVLIIIESVHRIIKPETTDARGMLFFAVTGIALNLFAFLRLKKGESLNEKIVSLHFIEDILGWLAVLAGAVVLMFASIPLLDPILSLCISAFILFNVYRNMRSAFQIILQGVPLNISEEKIRAALANFGEVKNVHDIHVWTMDGTYHVATLHLALSAEMGVKDMEALKAKVKQQLHLMGIHHATIETETRGSHCDLEEC